MVQQQPPSIKGETKDKLDSFNLISWHNKENQARKGSLQTQAKINLHGQINTLENNIKNWHPNPDT